MSDDDLIRRGDAIKALSPMLRDMISRGQACRAVSAVPAAALPARGVGVPDGWHMERLLRGNGFLFYTLRQDGWRKGEPIMVNDVTIKLEPAPGSETDLEPIAARILAALAPTDAAQAREAALHPDAMLPEAIRLIRQEATRDHSQEVVTGLKHIALLLEQLINEARDD